MQVYVEGVPCVTRSTSIHVGQTETMGHLTDCLIAKYILPAGSFYLSYGSRVLHGDEVVLGVVPKGASIQVHMRMLGGIDFQHREGSKIGSGGQLSEAQAALGRRDRLRKLALETIDLQKDPYFMRNHLGSYECKLCLTLHSNEGNYLAHTQAKRHQSNLGRRAAMEAKVRGAILHACCCTPRHLIPLTPLSSFMQAAAPVPVSSIDIRKRKTIKIGRPAYKVTKSKDVETQQRSLTFEIDYLEADDSVQPRHRFMSAYEQKVEVPDKNYQYILFACDPYDTIAFKIPNQPIDKREGRFFTSWDAQSRKFVLSLIFL